MDNRLYGVGHQKIAFEKSSEILLSFKIYLVRHGCIIAIIQDMDGDGFVIFILCLMLSLTFGSKGAFVDTANSALNIIKILHNAEKQLQHHHL